MRLRSLLHLLQQRNLPGMISRMLRHPVQHEREVVMRSPLAWNLLGQGCPREFLYGSNQLFMRHAQVCQRCLPCCIAGIGNGRKILRGGKLRRGAIHAAPRHSLPGRNVQHQFPMLCAFLIGRAAACAAVTPLRILNSESPCHASPSKARRKSSAMRPVSLMLYSPNFHLGMLSML